MNMSQQSRHLFSLFVSFVKRFTFKHKFITITAAILLAIALWLLIPPRPPFPDSYSRVVYDCRGGLLRVTSAPDGQIRFPLPADPLPRKYIAALTACEDRRFFAHPGVDPLALAKSLFVNIRSGRRLRGGSTITMQVARLSHPKKRSYFNKALECAGALKLSLHMNKQALLRLYAGHVPMGGNIVGVHAASWRYFGKPLSQITWAEAALFTVLPNSPSALNLVKERPRLKEKRDRALAILLHRGLIDSMSCSLSQCEPLPSPANRMPFRAPHFAGRVLASSGATVVLTTLDPGIQQRTEEIVRMYSRQYAAEGVKNMAALVVSTQSGAVCAYAGSQDFSDTANDGQVDGIMARRSTGSLLKPFLVAKTLDRGPYVLESKLQDVPTFYGSFYPQNASKEFSGLATLQQSLVQSLNVPMVRLLYWYGVNEFYSDLRNAGFSGLFRTSEGYGLSLILGGAEASLWELAGLFCGLGNMGMLRPFHLCAGSDLQRDTVRMCSEGAAWLVLSTLSQLNRPGSEYYWRFFSNQVPVAWKTGTSYGQKDAWAIGTNRQWTIAVWVGNFNGEGNASLGGAQSAGPVLFELFNALSDKSRGLWFTKPEYDLRSITVCRQSGLSPSAACSDTMQAEQPLSAYQTAICPFHQRLLVSKSKGFSACSRCWTGIDTVWKVKTIYPPSVRSILAQHGFKADSLPRHNPRCPVAHPQAAIEIVYPVENVSIIVPRNFQGVHEKIVFKAECQRPGTHLFWYLDGGFLAETVGQNTIAVDLQAGKHKLAVQDGEGETEVVRFEAYRKVN
jgi:penicillin-binding protein 1C